MKFKYVFEIIILCIFFSCTSSTINNRNLTLGLIQKNIKKGLSQTEILESIGSPNIITKNKKGEEVWTYDRISNEKKSQSRFGSFILNPFYIFGMGSSNYSKSESSSTSLTLIINYDNNNEVIDFSYQSLKY